MAVGDAYEVKVEVQGPGGERLVNVLHYVQTGGAQELTAGNIASRSQDISLIIMAPYLPCLSTTAKWGQITVTQITGDNAGIQGVAANNSGNPGTSAGTPGPIERALIIRKHGSIIGRKHRGRVFFPMPCLETFSMDGALYVPNPDADAQATLLDFFNLQLDLLPGTDIQLNPVIFHRGTHTWDMQISTTFSTLCGVQRRRRLGVGT